MLYIIIKSCLIQAIINIINFIPSGNDCGVITLIKSLRVAMKKVLASELKIGDVLGRDIVSGNGVLILKKGTVLNEKFINKIKNTKFAAEEIEENFVFIEKNRENSDKTVAQNKDYIKKEMRFRQSSVALLEKRFEKVKGDALMDEIKEIIKDVILKQTF